MATRVNTKFVLVLSATLVAASGIVLGLWVLHVRGDTTRHIKAGNELMAEGDYERAFKEYGRAVSKEPANLSHLQKVEEALLSIRPETRDRADELDRMRSQILRHRTVYRPQDPGVHLAFIHDLHLLARWFDRAERWQELANAAEEMWQRVPAGDPQRHYARLYRGLAHMRLLTPRTATDEEIRLAEQDLHEFVEAVPDSDLGWATLVAGQLAVARQLRMDGSTRRAEAAFRDVDETLKRGFEAVPDGPELARIAAFRLSIERDEGAGEVTVEQMEEAIDRMVDLVTPSNDPMLLAEATALLRTVDREQGLSRSIDMLRRYVDANPDMLYQRFMLATLHFLNRDNDAAHEAATAVIEADPVPVGVLSRIQHTLRTGSASLIIDIEYLLLERADDADKPAQLAKVTAARDRLALLLAEPENEPALLDADGKIAMARRDFATAAAKFERIIKLQLNDDLETLWNAALSLEQIGQLGLALERFQQAGLIQPRNAGLLAHQARIQYRIGRYDDARRTIAAVLHYDPDNQYARQLLTTIEAGDTSQAEVAAIDDPVAKALVVAEAAHEEGDLDAALAALVAALEQDPESLVVLSQLIRTELRRGQSESARAYLDRALEIQPNNHYMQKVKASLSTEDQVEALKQYMAGVYPDEGERAVHTVIHLRGLAKEMDAIADRQTGEGDEQAAAKSRDAAARARASADESLATARAIVPGHPSLIEHLFKTALVANDWPGALAMVEQARIHDADQAGGQIFKGRYELAREDLNAAVLALTEATARKHYSALAWRLLGRAHDRLGNFPEALRAYEQAYDCNPNDRYAVRWYVNLLMQTGEKTRAVRVLRNARHSLSSDILLREVRLELEAEVGNLRRAIAERRKIYKEQPDLRGNAIRLAALLGRSTPTFEHIRTVTGELMYDADSWRVISERQRQELLAEVSAKWISESEGILDALAVDGEDSIELVSLRADLMRVRGQVDAGEQVLRDYADGQDEPSARTLVILSQYLATVNQIEDAVNTLKDAQQYQDPETRLADHALADLYFNHGAWGPAHEIYWELYQAGAMEQNKLRLVECAAKLGRFDEADEVLDQVVADDGAGFLTTMLAAAIAQGIGDQLYAEERTEEADLKYVEELEALDRAEQMRPSSPMPHVRRAQRLVRAFDRNPRRTLLDDALRALERADDVQAGAEATSVMRVDILRKLGDSRGAIGELARLLTESPDNAAARRLLVQLYVETGNHQTAMSVVDDAILRNPTVALWHEMKGDLFVVQRDIPAAIVAFDETYRLQPTKGRLAKLAETSLVVDEPDYEKITELMSNAGAVLEDNPLARGFYARALTGLEDDDAAIGQMDIAFDEHMAMIEREPATRVALVAWYRSLQVVFAGKQATELEQFVREATGGEPDALALQWIARSWVVLNPDDGVYRAIELSREALDKYPDEDVSLRVQLFLDLGQFEVETAQYPAAVKSFENAIAIEPRQPLALNNAAYLYAEKLGDPARAIQLAERAVEMRPNDPYILDTLGWACFKAGRYDDAENSLRRAIAAEPSADNHLHLAFVLARTDRRQKAEIYLRRAAELRPGEETLNEILRLAEEINR